MLVQVCDTTVLFLHLWIRQTSDVVLCVTVVSFLQYYKAGELVGPVCVVGQMTATQFSSC